MRRILDLKSSIWNRNFTSYIMGNFFYNSCVLGLPFILSLFILDLSNSTYLYGVTLFLNYLSSVLIPIFFAPFIEQSNKKKVCLFCNVIFIIIVSFYMLINVFDFYILVFSLLTSLLIGIFGSIFNVASNSLLLELVDQKNMQKACSVNELVLKLSEISIPIVTFIYRKSSLYKILIFFIFLLICAFSSIIFIKNNSHIYGTKNGYLNELNEGFKFIKRNNSYLFISILFFLCTIFSGIRQIVWVPFFKMIKDGSELWYFIVYGFFATGMLHSSVITYLVKIKKDKNYIISSLCFVIMSISSMFLINSNIIISAILGYISGISYGVFNNLKANSIYNKLDDNIKSRVIGVFNAFENAGIVFGIGVCTLLTNTMSLQNTSTIVSIVSLLIFIVVNFFIGKSKIKELYNK